MDKTFWRQQTRDGWFFAALALASIGVAWVFWPYVYVLLVALVTVVVSWPLHKRVMRFCNGRKALSAFFTTVLMAILVFGPLSYLVYLFASEINSFIVVATSAVEEGMIQSWVDHGLSTFKQLTSVEESSWVPGFVSEALSNERWVADNLQAAAGQVQQLPQPACFRPRPNFGPPDQQKTSRKTWPPGCGIPTHKDNWK